MADKNKKNTEQRQRPKGYEIRESLKPKKSNPEQSYRRERRAQQLQDRLTEQDVKTAEGALAAEATDPFLSRNEFKPGFYNQPDKRPVTAETMYGTGTTRQLDESIMSPDDSMLMEYKQKGGSVMVKTKLGKTKPTKLY